MPELPEVESIRRSLAPLVTGRQIGCIEVLTPGVFSAGSLPVSGWRIVGLERRGKYLVFRLSGFTGAKACLVVHLRMTGRLLLEMRDTFPVKHDHVRIRLEPAEPDPAARPVWLRYHDPRRFGRIWLMPTLPEAGGASSATGPAGLATLGPEPLGRSFGAQRLADRLLAHRKAVLKAVLLNQTVIAGLGNIYADESLFAAGLHPARRVQSLSEKEIVSLARAIRRVLKRAIACQGTTLRDYVNGWNQRGTFQDCLMVYGRAGQPCRRCGQPIERTRLAGRTTCWCPSCQPETADVGTRPTK